MATRQDYLKLAADQAAQRLSELDTVAVSDRAKMTYTDNLGQTYGWNEYRQHLLDMLTAIQGAPAGGSSLIQQAGGPFTVLG